MMQMFLFGLPLRTLVVMGLGFGRALCLFLITPIGIPRDPILQLTTPMTACCMGVQLICRSGVISFAQRWLMQSAKRIRNSSLITFTCMFWQIRIIDIHEQIQTLNHQMFIKDP